MCGWGGGGGSDHLYRHLENCVFILSHCISKATIVLSCSMMKRQYDHLPCNHDNNKVTPEDECPKLEFSAVLRQIFVMKMYNDLEVSNTSFVQKI